MGGGDRDLKMEEAAAMEGGDLNLKLQAVAIEGGFHELSIVEGDRDLESKMKGAVGSEGGDTLKRNEASRAWEVKGEILKLKKGVLAAWDLWFLTHAEHRKRNGTQENANAQTQETAQASAGAGKKKRKKVVKIKLRDDYVDFMAANPFRICADVSEEEVARQTTDFHKIFAAGKFLEAKHDEYWKVLIAQKAELGYAEDENEVTDDDDDEEEEVVVKN